MMARRMSARLVPDAWIKNEENGGCPVCGLHKEKWTRRKDWRCCCTECTAEYFKVTFLYWPDIRAAAIKRDNFSCVKCGDNREIVDVEVKYQKWLNAKEYFETFNRDIKKPRPVKLKYESAIRIESRTNLCGDHIIAVALGGEDLDIDNVQTLCLACHKIKTKEDMGKIAKMKRVNKILGNNQKTL